MTKIKIIACILLSLLMLTPMLGCQKPAPPTEKITISGEDTVVIDGISQAKPEQNMETVEDMKVSSTNGKASGVLLRFTLPPAITAAAVQSAQLRLKYKSGDSPSLKVAGVTQTWQRSEATWNTIHSVPPINAETSSQKDENDYYSIDVTTILQKWFNGSMENSGFLVTQAKDNTSTVFYSPYNCKSGEYPELVIHFQKITFPSVGTYVYKEQDNGNCLSFALRDTAPIYAENLGVDMTLAKEKYKSSGVEALLQYTDELILDYISKHKEALQINSIRRIDNFNSDIEEGEYRFALRVGAMSLQNQLDDYDYHLQVQLTDGSWGEKLGKGSTRIVPGSNIENDPSLYPWDSSLFVDNPLHHRFYNSTTIFYAVKKNTMEYTKHY